MDSAVPLRGFGPSKDGAGFGKLTRQRQAVREHITGGALPERLLPRMPPAEEEDLAVVEQLIKASGKTRRRRKKSRDSAGSGQSVRRQQVVEAAFERAGIELEEEVALRDDERGDTLRD